jgi:DNA replication and repair protein RecF
MALVEGSPSARRRYLDATICQVDPIYSAALGEYSKLLPQRNALLKQLQRRTGSNDGQLEFWDEQLCRSGAVLIARRIRAIEEIENYAVPIYEQLTDGAEHLRLVYRPSYDPVENHTDQLAFQLDVPAKRSRLSDGEIAAGLQVLLRDNRTDEIMRGMTMVGPHRDELRFLVSGVDLGNYGSRGQSRSAILALKLAEMDWMHDRSGERPVLLLDEVLVELDPSRRRDLLSRINGSDQTILTTTDLNMFEAPFRMSAEVWAVKEGNVSPLGNMSNVI